MCTFFPHPNAKSGAATNARPATEYNSPMHSFLRASLIALAAGAIAMAASSEYLTFIGDFGNGVPAFRLDTATGKLSSLGSVATSKSPA